MLIVSLALFLTYFVMEPVFLTAWENGVSPLVAGDLSPEDAAAEETLAPFRVFHDRPHSSGHDVSARRVAPGNRGRDTGNRAPVTSRTVVSSK